MLHAVVMAGGSGTRFWPKSRRNRPKQLLRLYGDATMLQQTVARIAPLVPPDADPDHHRRRPGRGGPGAAPRPAGRERRGRALPARHRALRRPGGQDRRRGRPRGDDDRDAGRPRDRARRSRSGKTVRAAVAVIDADPDGVRHLRYQADPARDRLRLHRARRVAGRRPTGSRCTASPSSARSPTAPPPSSSWPRAGSPGTRASSSGAPAPSSTPWRDAPPHARRRARPDRAGPRHARRGRDDRPRVTRGWSGSRSTRP